MKFRKKLNEIKKIKQRKMKLNEAYIDWDYEEPEYKGWKNKNWSQSVDYAKHIQDKYYSKSSKNGNNKESVKEKIYQYYLKKKEAYPLLKEIKDEILSCKSLGEAISLINEFILNDSKNDRKGILKEDRTLLGVGRDEGQAHFYNKKDSKKDSDDWLEGRL
jgi:hypothetical protein